MVQFIYRLQLLLEQKEETRKAAAVELSRREQQYEAENATLQSLQQREKKLTNSRRLLRTHLLSQPNEGTALAGREVLKRSDDLKVVDLEIEQARTDIASQTVVVERCKAEVQQAKVRAEEARREVEVLTKHRKKQEQRFMQAVAAAEELALDEIGNVLHASRRRPL